MGEEPFYTTCAQVAFALLGLWWVVVVERFREWMDVPARRRQAYTVSLYFMLPGIMSLASLISPGEATVWRLTFGVAGAIGLGEAVLATARREMADHGWRTRVLVLLTLPVFAAVLAVAIHTKLPQDVGLNVKPLEAEAILVSALLFVGVNVAWALFLERPRDQASRP